MLGVKNSLPSLLFSGVILAGCQAVHQEPAETSREQIMVVLDSSASMSETVNGRFKQEIMRDSFGAMLKSWEAQNVDAGLVVFGRQSEDDCADIELIDRPRPVEAVSLGRVAYKLSPKGKAPISEAVFVAAKHLNPSDGPSKIIAITGGQDTCGHDPCLLAHELKNMNIELEVRNVSNGSQSFQCGIIEETPPQNPGDDDYNSFDDGLQIQALRHDTGEPMWPMTWILYGPEDAEYELSDDNPTLDLSRMEATELRSGDYTITGFSGDYAGSSNFTLGANAPEKNVIYVILYADVPHADAEE